MIEFEQFLGLGLINLGLAATVGIVLGYSALLDAENETIQKWPKILLQIIIFGIMAVVGTYMTASMDVGYNFRDGGVISGGLFFGGAAGIGAAILSVAYRSTLGGVTMIPCLIGTMLAGIISAYIYHRYRDRINVLTATLAALGIELLHALVIIIYLGEEGIEIVFHTPVGLFVVMSTLSVLVFSLCYTTMKKKHVRIQCRQ